MGRRCCCNPLCLVFTDDFDRTPSTNLGADWDEAQGQWEITASNTVKNSPGAADDCILTVDTTTNSHQQVQATIASVVSGRKYRVIFNAIDENNYHFVELEAGSPDTLRWYKRTDGSNSLLREETLYIGGPESNDAGFWVCVDDISITVEFSPTPTGARWYHCEPDLFPNGLKAGLGNGAAYDIEFSDFTLQNRRGVIPPLAGERDCCTKECRCEEDGDYHCMPHVLTCTLTATGGCNKVGYLMDGVTFDLIRHPDGYWESYDSSTQHSDANTPYTTGTEGAHPVCRDENWWVLNCGNSACGTSIPAGKFFMFTNRQTIAGCTDFDDCITYDDAEVSYTCDPLTIVLPVLSYAVEEPLLTCWCCDSGEAGTLYAIITEQVL